MKQVAIYIPQLDYECIFLEDAWKVIYGTKERTIYRDNFYGYPFYAIFNNIEMVCQQLEIIFFKNEVKFSAYFPIELILKDIIEHRQEYWLDLCLDFIIRINYLDNNIIGLLNNAKEKKIFSQAVRNKMSAVLKKC